MNNFKNKWIFIITILVIILGIVIFNNKDDISNLIGINNKNVFDSNTDQSYWVSDVCYKKDPFINVYEYNDSVSEGEKGYCISGKEDTCLESKCYKDKSVGSCSAGTIVHYYVKETDDYYFNVLHDDGETMTLQSVDAITQSAWGTSTSEGPITVLDTIENATKGWSNVNELNYCLGKGCTPFLKYPNLTYTQNDYTAVENVIDEQLINPGYTYGENVPIDRKKVRARILSTQEALDLGCSFEKKDGSCPLFLYYNNVAPTTFGNTYWQSRGDSTYAFYITTTGYIWSSSGSASVVYNIHAVVEINK